LPAARLGNYDPTLMRSAQRSRRYVASPLLAGARPLFRYSYSRDAYVLRLVGRRLGPVIRRNRRSQGSVFADPDRRAFG
jgi:hypothetical protein